MFSKLVKAKVVPSTDAASIIDTIYNWFLEYGAPETVLTDNAKGFISKAVEEAYTKFGIKGKHSQLLTTPKGMDKPNVQFKLSRRSSSKLLKAMNLTLSPNCLKHLQLTMLHPTLLLVTHRSFWLTCALIAHHYRYHSAPL
jgi:hypothetical protein